MKSFLAPSLLIFLLSVAGCATVGNQETGMEVAIEHISAPQFLLIESHATVRIRIDNETPDPIHLAGGVHNVQINGRRIGKALDGNPVEIPPYSSVIRELPLTVSNLGVIRSIRETVDSRRADYRLDSRLTIDTDGGRRTRSLTRSGDVSLDELMPPQGGKLSPLTPAPLTPAPIEPPQ